MKKFKSISVLTLVVFSTLASAQQQRINELIEEKESLIAENKILRDSLSRLTAYDTSKVYFTVALEKSKRTIYRGLLNKLTIIVPYAIWVEAEAPDLKKADDFGHYTITPGLGLTREIKIRAEMPDGSVYEDSRVFNIRNVPMKWSCFNGIAWNGGAIKLPIESIVNGIVSFEMVDFDYEINFHVTRFKIRFPNKEIEIEGNKLNEEAIQLLRKLKHKTRITIYDIESEGGFSGIILSKANPIVIEIDKKTASKE